MSMQHTTGPWVTGYDGHGGIYVEDAQQRQIGFVSAWPDQEANARLIAAAPDLLFQLLAAANYIDALGGESKSYRAAIAKATGAA